MKHPPERTKYYHKIPSVFSSQILIFYYDDTETQIGAQIKALHCTQSTPLKEQTWKEHYM